MYYIHLTSNYTLSNYETVIINPNPSSSSRSSSSSIIISSSIIDNEFYYCYYILRLSTISSTSFVTIIPKQATKA